MMRQTGNHQLVKKINKTLVLNMIKENGPLSRATVAHKLGLNRATVSSLVSELIDEKLVYESGIGESNGGRRPVMLLFNNLAGYTISVDVGVNYILGVLTNLGGKIIQEKNIPIKDTSYQIVVSQIKNIIRFLIKEMPDSPYGLLGIGIGVPGVVDTEGKILIAPNLGWRNVTFKKELEKEFNTEVIIENEANAGAYGEKKWGIGHKASDLIYLSIGIGIGTGLIIKNELYRGINGYAGELGHMIIDINGHKCRCGNYGCWELYASENTLLKEARDLSYFKNKHAEPTLELLMALAEQGNEEVIALFSEIGKYLGIGITNIIKCFNPKQIIIGNRLALAKKWIQKPLSDVLSSYTLKFYKNDLNIEFASLSPYSASLGLSSFVIESFLKNNSVMPNPS